MGTAALLKLAKQSDLLPRQLCSLGEIPLSGMGSTSAHGLEDFVLAIGHFEA